MIKVDSMGQGCLCKFLNSGILHKHTITHCREMDDYLQECIYYQTYHKVQEIAIFVQKELAIQDTS